MNVNSGVSSEYSIQNLKAEFERLPSASSRSARDSAITTLMQNIAQSQNREVVQIRNTITSSHSIANLGDLSGINDKDAVAQTLHLALEEHQIAQRTEIAKQARVIVGYETEHDPSQVFALYEEIASTESKELRELRMNAFISGLGRDYLRKHIVSFRLDLTDAINKNSRLAVEQRGQNLQTSINKMFNTATAEGRFNRELFNRGKFSLKEIIGYNFFTEGLKGVQFAQELMHTITFPELAGISHTKLEEAFQNQLTDYLSGKIVDEPLSEQESGIFRDVLFKLTEADRNTLLKNILNKISKKADTIAATRRVNTCFDSMLRLSSTSTAQKSEIEGYKTIISAPVFAETARRLGKTYYLNDEGNT